MVKAYQSMFISHGGGPLPLLGDAGHREMVACLEAIASMTRKPDAIVVVSAHWEAALPTICSGPAPALIYDYYGFPDESYSIEYPCAGAPSVAQRVHELLRSSGIQSVLDERRGFDHGLFVPLKIMYPLADIPCIQLSLVDSLDPLRHIEIGRALGDLYRDNVLIIGSGFSFHNLRAFFQASTSETRALNQSFEEWLQQACCDPDHAEEERVRLLAGWADAPGARYCHPRAEHLLPLHVCYGAAQRPCAMHYSLEIMHKASSMYLW